MDHKGDLGNSESDGDRGDIATKRQLTLKLWFCSSLKSHAFCKAGWRSMPTQWLLGSLLARAD